MSGLTGQCRYTCALAVAEVCAAESPVRCWIARLNRAMTSVFHSDLPTARGAPGAAGFLSSCSRSRYLRARCRSSPVVVVTSTPERIGHALFHRCGVASFSRRAFARFLRGTCSRASSSTWRTLRPRATISRASLRRWLADQRARMAGGQLAAADDSALTASGSFSSRSVLATWLRLLPTISASSSWV